MAMAVRYLIVCAILAGFFPSTLPFSAQEAEAAQTPPQTKKKTPEKKKKRKVDQREQYPHGLKNYPWGEPNAGWSDRCIFFYDTYDGWIPPICRPYGR